MASTFEEGDGAEEREGDSLIVLIFNKSNPNDPNQFIIVAINV